jgi:hypothetical protein
MKRTWALRFRRFMRRLLHLGDSPERTALAFAVGVFFGFSPLIGLHTVLGLIAAFVFRLNRVAVLVGVYLNTWTLAPMASLGTALGFLVLNTSSPFPPLSVETMLSLEFWRQMRSDVAHLLLPFLVGNLLLSLLAALVSYLIVSRLLRRYHHRRRARQLARAALNREAGASGETP